MPDHWPRARHVLPLLATLAAWSAACTEGPGGTGAVSDGPVVLDADAVHVLGTSESIAQVRDLEVMADGSVWILNSVEPFFVGFDPNGEVIREHGAAGGGPGEFLVPAAFVTGGIEGEPWVLDARRHALVRVSGEGEPEELSLRVPGLPPGSLVAGLSMVTSTVRTATLGGQVLLPRTTPPQEGGLFEFRMAILGSDLMALDPQAGSAAPVLALGSVLDDPTTGLERLDGGFPLWYRLWAVCGDQIRVYDRARNAVRAFGRDGTELEGTPLPPAPFTEVTPREFALAVFDLRAAEVSGGVGLRVGAADSARILDQMEQEAAGTPSQLAGYLPRYVDMRCSDGGTVWIQPLDPALGGLKGGQGWLRIAPDGAIREVRLPERFDAFRFGSERIWGVQRDELDVATVAWVEAPAG